MNGPVRREVVRVLLFDDRERVLLFFARDPTDPTNAYWYLPGGGIEPGESPHEAARREAEEEAALTPELGPVVCTLNNVRFRFRGQDFEQDEVFIVGWVPADTEVGHGRPHDLEADAVAAHHWWSVEELTGSSETFYPKGLLGIVGRLIREGPPAQPWLLPPESN